MRFSSKELLIAKYKSLVKYLKETFLIFVPLILVSGLILFYNYNQELKIEPPQTFIVNKFAPGTNMGNFNFLIAEQLSSVCTKIYLKNDFIFEVVVCSKNLSEKEKIESENYVKLPLQFEGQKYQYGIYQEAFKNLNTSFSMAELLSDVIVAIES